VDILRQQSPPFFASPAGMGCTSYLLTVLWRAGSTASNPPQGDNNREVHPPACDGLTMALDCTMQV
jgi:hypothetical protein